MFELNQLEKLVVIADEGTLSKAAEKLLISQPALTRSIQKLEEELHLQLFERKKNKIVLNENGKLAVEYARSLLIQANAMVTQLQAHERSHQVISIGACAPAPTWALRYVLHNINAHPNVLTEIHSDNEELIMGLNHFQYSLIVLNYPIDDDGCVCIPLFEENLYLSVPPAHPLALFKEVSFEDLNGESILLLSRIGFWNELCLEKLPNSHLLIQEDVSIFNELVKASALPNFKTNITIQKEQTPENRVSIPITDDSAHIQYYAIVKKENKDILKLIEENIHQLNWKNIE